MTSLFFPNTAASLGRGVGPSLDHWHRRSTAFSGFHAVASEDSFWPLICQIQNEAASAAFRYLCQSLCSFSARQSNLSDGGISRPAPWANLNGEEVCFVAFCFQVHRQICILFCLECIAILNYIMCRGTEITERTLQLKLIDSCRAVVAACVHVWTSQKTFYITKLELVILMLICTSNKLYA